ncbi:MAG: S24 family peptidase, partial [Pyrinomonadaceae bacterium]
NIVFVRATGLSMKAKMEAGIDDGDILAVERTGFARPGDVVVAEINGEFTIKRLKHHHNGLYLVPANTDYPICRVTRTDSFSVWAVVSYVVHKMRRAA